MNISSKLTSVLITSLVVTRFLMRNNLREKVGHTLGHSFGVHPCWWEGTVQEGLRAVQQECEASCSHPARQEAERGDTSIHLFIFSPGPQLTGSRCPDSGQGWSFLEISSKIHPKAYHTNALHGFGLISWWSQLAITVSKKERVPGHKDGHGF